ncbi:pyruvoyl-dependent arginine decarboxylase [Nocardia asteroides]|uniref:pyruvoyl-dependent arginine decarboxylase n=1 Tax=Nocardia asteroides TaxID=1824 RepID=UPI001E2C0290|nr:pyruvoyl-dependent arginine decarboxylase [Nocardia asteroides]UGT64017.1 pyruvoyl-dependent arginine decarboxylase [Nocardia asteroides]
MMHNTARGAVSAQRSALLGLPWVERLRTPASRPARAARSSGIPLTIEIGAATGTGPTALAAFDAALRELGVGEANLIRLSSVIPPRARLVRGARVRKPIAWGDRLYCVYAAEHTEEPGTLAAAGMGWVLRTDGSGAGLFVEHEAGSAAEVEALIRASLTDMTRRRSADFGPIQLCVTEIRAEAEPVCALVLAAYRATGWDGAR